VNQKKLKRSFELLCDTSNLQNYLIHILKNEDKNTIKAIEKKYKNAFYNKRRCCNCSDKNKLKIFLILLINLKLLINTALFMKSIMIYS
jgi:hypothetical protein